MNILENRAIAITGSGRGIGAACARGVARRGALVVVNDIDAAEAEETATAITAEGGKAVACVADISRWDDAKRLIETCISTYGRIDGLVNNAALFHRACVDEIEPDTTLAMVNANVLGSIFCTAHAVKPMLERKSGSIVNVVSGAHMGMRTMGVYGATKGAIASMIYTWAIELAGSGVRINGLSPLGSTRMGTSTQEERKDPAIAKMAAEIQSPEANSPVVEFLLSDLSSEVNGQIVRIDKRELQLYIHPALLIPPALRDQWTAETIAEAFDKEFSGRQVPCGVLAMTELPVEPKTGFWKRTESEP